MVRNNRMRFGGRTDVNLRQCSDVTRRPSQKPFVFGVRVEKKKLISLGTCLNEKRGFFGGIITLTPKGVINHGNS